MDTCARSHVRERHSRNLQHLEGQVASVDRKAEFRAAMKQAIEAAARKKSAAAETKRQEAVRSFWDLINTSGGEDACHHWLGKFRPSYDRQQPWYEAGLRTCGWGTALARRIVCFLTYGEHVPPTHDTTNLCDTDGCCNVRHIIISPKAKDHADRLNKGVPATEFFCDRLPVRD